MYSDNTYFIEAAGYLPFKSKDKLVLTHVSICETMQALYILLQQYILQQLPHLHLGPLLLTWFNFNPSMDM